MAIGIGGLLGIDAAANLLGGLFNTGISTYAQKSLMKYQSELQQQMVDRANEYNLPKNQVQRLLDGHLNPNLAYSSVNSVAGSSTPSVGLNSAASPNVRLELLGQMRQYQQYQTDKAVTRLQNANAEHQELENEQLRERQPYFKEMAALDYCLKKWNEMSAENKAKSDEVFRQLNEVMRDAKLGITNRQYDFMESVGLDGVADSPLFRAVVDQMTREGLKNDEINSRIDLYNERLNEIGEHINLMIKQGKNLDVRTELLNLEKEMKGTLGVSYSDNLGLRLLARFLSYYNVSPEKLAEILGKSLVGPLSSLF